MRLTEHAARERRYLRALERLERQALFFAANALSQRVTAALNGKKATTHYVDTYVNALYLAYLTGHKHVLSMTGQSVPMAITLSEGGVPFKEAIDALEAAVPVQSDEYRTYEAAIKIRAFTAAVVSEAEAVNAIKQKYAQALKTGQSKSQTMQEVGALLKQAGMTSSNPYWLELHYRNNMMTAYNTGRWSQIAHNALVEYLIYSSVMDDGTTDLCRHLDNVIKPKGDAFWEKFYPPNHHKCRATVGVASKADYESLSHSEKIRSGIALEKNLTPVMKKEHQFKSSPMESIDSLPESLVNKAKDYGLLKKVLTQLKTQFKPVLKAAITHAAVPSVPNKLNAFKEHINNKLDAPDEVWMGLQEDGAYRRFEWYQVIRLDRDHVAVIVHALFTRRKPMMIQMTNKEWEVVQKNKVTLFT
ncbi:phage minor head protein [Vibrio mediterranei]|uniref:phage head morphogenesis protein n=1 Tax=Vibrio mediterranei TaxID=689 RepID=UPI0022840912|nr:phage minor head protein [Vibrio mediterranei]MCY9855805.1 phage minor head protein [Vibrio mediterranei]